MNLLSFASLAVGHLRSRCGGGRALHPVLSLSLLLIVLASAPLLPAQSVYGAISGVVKDPSGAVVQGAAIAVRETASTTEYKTVTNKSGSYRVSFLKPGGYIVRFEKAGFAQFATSELHLVLNQELVVDGTLRLGEASEVVTVSNAGSSLNYTNSQIGGELSTSELIDLPENTSSKGANEFLITKTFAGASSTSQNYSNVNNLSLGGGRPVSNPIIIDGLPSNMGTDGTYGLIPTPDSTEELQVLTAPFSAQYGQSGGGAILTTTKSGTDHFHGSAFETYNSQDLVALGYFTAPGTIKPTQSFNYFGGSVGGPVRIPRLFDGRRHHLYFFTDWEDTINNAVKTVNTNVPTLAERSGDFSGISPQGTPTATIYDPTTTVVTNGKISRTPFSGNIIPKSRLDAVGLNIVAFFPQPNCSYQTYNYCLTPTAHTTYLYNADRIDYNPSDYDHLWAKFSRDGPRNQPTIVIPNAANTSAYGGWTDDHYAISWSHVFSPRISNEARVGYVSEVNFSYPAAADADSIGLKGVPLTQFPSISTSQYTSFGAGSYSLTRDGHYILNDAMVMQMGRHSLSLGGEFMRYAYSNYTPGVLAGSYSFTGTFTTASGQSGLGLPDLMLGYPGSSGISTTNTIFHQNLNYFAGYVQDDYRLFSNLTINLGLRYEFDGPYSEVHNNMYSFNPNIIDPTTQKMGGVQFAGRNGAPHSLIANVYTGILPRVGFNYHALRNTTVRGGYGIYELPSIGYGGNGLTSTSTVNVSFQSSNPSVTPAFLLSQGVPAYSPNVDANGNPLIPSSLTKPTANLVQQQLTSVLPYLQEWQLGVQQDLGHNWILDIDYAGNHGVHMPANLPINQIAPKAGCCNALANSQSLRPYPQYLSINYLSNAAASSYAALYATLSHRWSNGISVRAAYTWARNLDDVDGPSRADAAAIQNVYNLHAQWGIAMINVPQRFSLSAVYALPVGSGGRVLNHTPVLSQAIGHWKVSTVAQFQQGYPYFVSQNDQLGIFSGGQYVTKVGDPNLPRGSRTVQKWFNTSAFAITPVNTLGNAPRAALYGPGQNVWDLSLMRDVPIHERMKFTLRVDAHNAFNHPQFSGLNTSITNAAFGTVNGAQDPRQVLLIGRFSF
ncbi:TonB-dependent Receptor Plug Domain [Granulicella pectinivorans]|uniref:TonB-dependent Receptor Plug Domain n=1 Tax=Granulicella pectinivorans TaxID=474950 RepID=A0A1I6MCZ0_9BACT|nr:carboxypeptidase regulatory-like domain-containing protein [Granulicella pectinivorans]SFS13616.1 TonB-dependent Receptor Plug Domain [Granulicella pectinivorans]